MPNATLRPRKKIEAQTVPSHLQLTATARVEVEAAADGSSTALPRFQMVGYTGGPMRVAGWRHPVILDWPGCRFHRSRDRSGSATIRSPASGIRTRSGSSKGNSSLRALSRAIPPPRGKW
jgi:hypothetical protein